MPIVELFPFRYRDMATRKWVRRQRHYPQMQGAAHLHREISTVVHQGLS
jgi:hypothetical protein